MSHSHPHGLPPRVVVRAGEPCPQVLRTDDPDNWPSALSWPRGIHVWLEGVSSHCAWCGQHASVPRTGWTVYDPSSDSVGYYTTHAKALDEANRLWCKALRYSGSPVIGAMQLLGSIATLGRVIAPPVQ